MTNSLAKVHAEGRLIRNRWAGTDTEGRQLLCLYTALAGDPEARPESCPASLAPKWIAHLLPWIDDAGTAAAWQGIVARVVALAPRLTDVPAECEWRVRALCVLEVMRHTSDPVVLSVCERVASLCEARGRGETVELETLAAARFAARSAAYSAYAAADAAAAAADAAYAARSAAAAAYSAADAADAARSAADAADAADRLIDAILTEIERSLP